MNERRKLKLTTFMTMCEELAKLSYDPKYQVATMIFTADFREICSIGYNGEYKGGPNARTSLEPGGSGFLHAEENSIISLAKSFELRGQLVLMCTHKPCTMCAKRIVNAGITQVIFKNHYQDTFNQTDEIFTISGVSCHSFDVLINS